MQGRSVEGRIAEVRKALRNAQAIGFFALGFDRFERNIVNPHLAFAGERHTKEDPLGRGQNVEHNAESSPIEGPMFAEVSHVFEWEKGAVG